MRRTSWNVSFMTVLKQYQSTVSRSGSIYYRSELIKAHSVVADPDLERVWWSCGVLSLPAFFNQNKEGGGWCVPLP